MALLNWTDYETQFDIEWEKTVSGDHLTGASRYLLNAILQAMNERFLIAMGNDIWYSFGLDFDGDLPPGETNLEGISNKNLIYILDNDALRLMLGGGGQGFGWIDTSQATGGNFQDWPTRDLPTFSTVAEVETILGRSKPDLQWQSHGFASKPQGGTLIDPEWLKWMYDAINLCVWYPLVIDWAEDVREARSFVSLADALAKWPTAPWVSSFVPSASGFSWNETGTTWRLTRRSVNMTINREARHRHFQSTGQVYGETSSTGDWVFDDEGLGLNPNYGYMNLMHEYAESDAASQSSGYLYRIDTPPPYDPPPPETDRRGWDMRIWYSDLGPPFGILKYDSPNGFSYVAP
jgi:hypothetical protein